MAGQVEGHNLSEDALPPHQDPLFHALLDLSLRHSQITYPLTDREREVAILWVHSWTHREIGTALGIEPKTSEAHLRNIGQKATGFRSSTRRALFREFWIEYGRELERRTA
jgi:DNA-binding NarL/FixJ family response regulator